MSEPRAGEAVAATAALAGGRLQSLQSLQMLRAVAALLVVLFHTEAIFGRRTDLPVFGNWFSHGGHGVDLFFVLSGFVITYVHRRDWGHPRRLGNYLFNRISRIYPAACVMSVLALALYVLGPRFGISAGMRDPGQSGKLGVWSIVASIMLLPQQGTALVNVTWTLKHEMVFYLIFAMLILERRLIVLLFIWQAIVLALVWDGVDFDGQWIRFYLSPMSLEFGLGMACAWLVMHRQQVPALARRTLPTLGLLLGVALSVGYSVLDGRWTGLPAVPDFLIYGGSGALIVTSLALLEMSGRLPSSAILLHLGNASYAIYLVHFSVIMLLSGILQRLKFVPMNNITFIAVAACGVLAGLAFHHFVDQPLQRLLRRAKPRLLGFDPRGRRLQPSDLPSRAAQ